MFSPTASQPVLWLDTRITIQLRILFPAKVMTYTVLLHINYCPQLPQQHHPNMNIHGQLLLFPDIGSDARDILFFFFFCYFLQPFCPHSIRHVAAAFSNAPPLIHALRRWHSQHRAKLVRAEEDGGGGGGGVLPDDFTQTRLSGARARRPLDRSAAQCRCSERLMELTVKPQPMAWGRAHAGVCARVCVEGDYKADWAKSRERERKS